MNRAMFVLAVFLGLGITQSVWARDSIVAEGQWYFSPLLGVTFEDQDRRADTGISGSLGFGKQISGLYALEFSIFGGLHEGHNEFRPMGVGVDLIRNLGSQGQGRVAPYLVLGTGWIRPDIVEAFDNGPETDYDNFIGTLGLGLITPLGDSAARFRAEVRYREDFHDPDFSDLLIMAGFYVPIGTPGKSQALPDSDGDGVADDVDLCPATTAGAQVDTYGCELDSDGDGVADSKDRCPNTPAGTKVDSRGCEIQLDSDGDGVADNDDRCPGTPRSARVDAAGCELDSDGDGVVDSLDSCPDTAKGVRIDVRGCEIKDKIELPGVRFELNSADLISESTAILDQAAETLRRNPQLKVEAAGYTDSTGTPSHNLDLSQRRAESVRRYLISKGANGDNISAKGYGEANPIADNSTRPGRQQNRRVDLRVLN